MNPWMAVAIATWALWFLQALAIALYWLPRAAHFWAHQGYVMGREDERNGVPRVAFVRLPEKEGER